MINETLYISTPQLNSVDPSLPILKPEDTGIKELHLKSGNQYFIVGTNGSGKSALLLYMRGSIPNTKWISAHRGMCLPIGGTTFTSQSRKEYSTDNPDRKVLNKARWQDVGSEAQTSAVLFDLIVAENQRNERITQCVDEKKDANDYANRHPSPKQTVNKLFEAGNLLVRLYDIGEDGYFGVKRGTGQVYEWYEIEQMSDGERNALIIAAHVILAKPHTVFFY